MFVEEGRGAQGFRHGFNILGSLVCSFRCWFCSLSSPSVCWEATSQGTDILCNWGECVFLQMFKNSFGAILSPKTTQWSREGKAWVLKSEAWGSNLGLCFHIWETAAKAFHLSFPTGKMEVVSTVSSSWENFVGIKWDYAWENAFLKSNS